MSFFYDTLFFFLLFYLIQCRFFYLELAMTLYTNVILIYTLIHVHTRAQCDTVTLFIGNDAQTRTVGSIFVSFY